MPVVIQAQRTRLAWTRFLFLVIEQVPQAVSTSCRVPGQQPCGWWTLLSVVKQPWQDSLENGYIVIDDKADVIDVAGTSHIIVLIDEGCACAQPESLEQF